MDNEAIVEMLRLLLGSYKHHICKILVRHQEGGEVAVILFLINVNVNTITQVLSLGSVLS